MSPIRKAVLQSVFRWSGGLSGGSAGLTGATIAGVPSDALGSISPWVPLVMGLIASLSQLGLGILDKIPDAKPPQAG